MNKSLYWIIILILIIILAGFVGRENNKVTNIEVPVVAPTLSETSGSPASASAENIVIYTDNGYTPAELRVKVGSIVTFKNESEGQVWTASAKHPTHNVYPTTGGCLGSTFDSCKGFTRGESWNFKFDIAGNWKYHNHLDTTKYGSITVEN